jgi:hypothetical protein
MSSCQCDGIASKFDEEYATEKLERYRENGPDPSTRALVEALLESDLRGLTLLDIGGGVGAVQHELLRAGVRSAQEIEASGAYADACRSEAARQGHDDRIRHTVGDFASVADTVETADIVTLDRSICCWQDMPSLVDRAASKSRHLFGLVYPRDAWWVRYGWRLYSNGRNALRRNPMRVFNHRTREVEAVLNAGGLTRRSRTTVGVWQIVVYERQ